MDIRLDNKRVLVTGAGKGIGRSLVKALVECGAETIALTRTQSDLDSLKKECLSIHTVCVDLTDWDATRKAVQDIGVIDLLVNNAGIVTLESFLDTTRETFERTLSVNLTAAFNVSQVVAKGMVERGNGGAIVSVSSTVSKIGVVNFTAYGASKGGLDELTRIMALELGPHQIRVNTVNPTYVRTNMIEQLQSDPATSDTINKMIKEYEERIPQGKIAEVKDVVHAVLYLLSDKSDMINGVSLMVDGGLTIC